MTDSDSPPPNTNSSNKNAASRSIVSRYRNTLTGISARTGTALPALITSFAILHEATAIIPLVGVFYTCRTFGVGERVVTYAREASSSRSTSATRKEEEGGSWIRETTERWMEEGEQWTEKVGRRYGIWGFQKGSTPPSSPPSTTASGINVAGDVANALVAYCATKALLPVRIGVSLYFSPAFARGVVVPISRSVGRIFRK
ncbi:hypothetical protein ACEPAH_3046 [Sanghuangporus vaninii]